MKSYLKNIAKNWEKSALVKKNINFSDIDFIAGRPDFLESLLPFSTSDRYKTLDAEKKSHLLTYAWFLYNQKTLDLELNVVNPLCKKILENKIPEYDNFDKSILFKVISQLMIDESYHVYMVHSANEITIRNRGIYPSYSNLSFVEAMNDRINQAENEVHKTIILFSVAIVAEILTSKSMIEIKNSKLIQPLHQRFTELHWLEEVRHGNVFNTLSKYYYEKLDINNKDLMTRYMKQALNWFSMMDLSHWINIFNKLGLNSITKEDFLSDLKALEMHKLKSVDYSVLDDISIYCLSTDNVI